MHVLSQSSNSNKQNCKMLNSEYEKTIFKMWFNKPSIITYVLPKNYHVFQYSLMSLEFGL